MPKNMKHFECMDLPFCFVCLLSKCLSKEMSVKLFCFYLTTDLLQTVSNHKISHVQDPCHFYNPSEVITNDLNGPSIQGEVGVDRTMIRAIYLAKISLSWLVELAGVPKNLYFVIQNPLEYICRQIKTKQFGRHFLTKAITMQAHKSKRANLKLKMCHVFGHFHKHLCIRNGKMPENQGILTLWHTALAFGPP